MNIEEFIKKEAPEKHSHDIAYAKALQQAYDVYKDMNLGELKQYQENIAEQPDSYSTNKGCERIAALMILSELIQENRSRRKL